MFRRVPFNERWQLLGNSLEETNYNANGGGLHIVAELIHGSVVRDTVVAVELHALQTARRTDAKMKMVGQFLSLSHCRRWSTVLTVPLGRPYAARATCQP